MGCSKRSDFAVVSSVAVDSLDVPLELVMVLVASDPAASSAVAAVFLEPALAVHCHWASPA